MRTRDRRFKATPASRLRRRTGALARGETGESVGIGRRRSVRRLPELDGALAATAVESPVPGSVWKILVEPGREVAEGETLIIVESMKMEIAVCAPSSGLVREVRCAEGRSIQVGQALVIMGEA